MAVVFSSDPRLADCSKMLYIYIYPGNGVRRRAIGPTILSHA